MSGYLEIASKLREKILSGKLKPQERLAAEREMSLELKVSRITVRRALNVLEKERLLTRRQGSGTYVSPMPERRIPLGIDYSGSMRKHAPSIKRKLLKTRVCKAPAEIMAVQGAMEGEDFAIVERRDSLDGQPVALDTGWIPLRLAERLSESDYERIDFVETLSRKSGIPLALCEQEVEAVPAEGREAAALKVPEGAPLLKSLEAYRSPDGSLLGYFVSLYNPRFISIRATYNWGGISGGGARGDE